MCFGVGERRRLADAVKHHTRDRNRPPSEPAGNYVFCIYISNLLTAGRTPRSRKN